MFDLSQLEIKDSGTYQVTDARGNDVVVGGQPLTLTIASPGTKKAVSAQFKRDEARSARVMGVMGGVKSKRTADDEIRERADFLMAITEGCSHTDISYNGKTGMDALHEMFLAPKLGHISDGAEKYHGDRGNFFEGSANSSANTSATQPG
jgi:hypothetical protein